MEKVTCASKLDIDGGASLVLASACMKTADAKKIFLRVSPELKKEWQALCAKVKMKEQQAGVALVEWILRQPRDIQLAAFEVSDDKITLARSPGHANRLPTTATGEGEPGNNPKPTPRGGFDPAAEVKPHWGRKKKG